MGHRGLEAVQLARRVTDSSVDPSPAGAIPRGFRGVSYSTITATNPALTTTGVTRGLDVDITIEHDGHTYRGVATLIEAHDGDWVSWGEPANWASQSLLDAVGTICSCDLSRSGFLVEVVAYADEAIRANWDDLSSQLDEAETDREEDDADGWELTPAEQESAVAQDRMDLYRNEY